MRSVTRNFAAENEQLSQEAYTYREPSHPNAGTVNRESAHETLVKTRQGKPFEPVHICCDVEDVCYFCSSRYRTERARQVSSLIDCLVTSELLSILLYSNCGSQLARILLQSLQELSTLPYPPGSVLYFILSSAERADYIGVALTSIESGRLEKYNKRIIYLRFLHIERCQYKQLASSPSGK
jgi:hypothetical protein